MQALVIYDNAGNIWNVTYGDSAKPERLGSTRLEIPDGAQITDMQGNQKGITESVDGIIETIVDNDYRLSLMELGL